MINNPKDSDNFPLKQEGLSSSDHHEKAKAPSSSSSSQWLRLKDPRIVRVSRAFGGKDRHSKVCTIRGLRDRRVRLSVPTAISLYDLQDRLGLSQPSKVVDWLLNAAKHEIDELPPLPVVPNNFTLGFQSLGTSHHNDVNNAIWKPKCKEVISGEEMVNDEEEEDNKEGEGGGGGAHDVLPNSNNSILLPSSRPNNNLIPSFLGLVNTIPFGYQWDQNSSSSSSGDVVAAQLGNNHHNGSSDHMHSINVVPFPSNHGGSQILVCPPPGAAATTTQSYFPSLNVAAAAMEMDPRQIINSHYHQVLMNSVNPSHHHQHHLMMTRMAPKLFHSANKDQDFPSK